VDSGLNHRLVFDVPTPTDDQPKAEVVAVLTPQTEALLHSHESCFLRLPAEAMITKITI